MYVDRKGKNPPSDINLNINVKTGFGCRYIQKLFLL